MGLSRPKHFHQKCRLQFPREEAPAPRLGRNANEYMRGLAIAASSPGALRDSGKSHVTQGEPYAHRLPRALLYGELMARYVTTINSSKSPDEAFAYMADLRNFAEWDKGVIKVEQIGGSGAGMGTIFDVTVKGVGKSTSTLRYTTTEYDAPRNVLVKGVNTLFTSIDRVTITPTATGCDVIYDATLTANWIIAPMNLLLGKVFNKIGDTATRGLRKVLA
jgi:hypothetical protein